MQASAEQLPQWSGSRSRSTHSLVVPQAVRPPVQPQIPPGAHAPNEYLVVEPKAGSPLAGLVEMEQFYVDLLYALAEAPR